MRGPSLIGLPARMLANRSITRTETHLTIGGRTLPCFFDPTIPDFIVRFTVGQSSTRLASFVAEHREHTPATDAVLGAIRGCHLLRSNGYGVEDALVGGEPGGRLGRAHQQHEQLAVGGLEVAVPELRQGAAHRAVLLLDVGEVELGRRAEAGAEALPGGELRPGVRVRIVSLGQEGEVVEVDDGEALIRAGALKLRRPVTDLVPLQGAPATPGWPAPRARSWPPPTRPEAAPSSAPTGGSTCAGCGWTSSSARWTASSTGSTRRERPGASSCTATAPAP